LNRCRGFCRPLPNHSATPPDHPSCRCERSVYPGKKRGPRNEPSRGTTGFVLPGFERPEVGERGPHQAPTGVDQGSEMASNRSASSFASVVVVGRRKGASGNITHGQSWREDRSMDRPSETCSLGKIPVSAGGNRRGRMRGNDLKLVEGARTRRTGRSGGDAVPGAGAFGRCLGG
jgi:hypothetical protein